MPTPQQPVQIDRAEHERAENDRFGVLFNLKQAFAPQLREFEALTIVIRNRDCYRDLAADQTALAIGNHYEVQIGERSIEKSWLSMPAVSKAAGGAAKFLKICQVTFKALSESIGQPAAEALQTEARTGNRPLKAVTRVFELPKAA